MIASSSSGSYIYKDTTNTWNKKQSQANLIDGHGWGSLSNSYIRAGGNSSGTPVAVTEQYVPSQNKLVGGIGLKSRGVIKWVLLNKA
jgi:hypothetical protein